MGAADHDQPEHPRSTAVAGPSFGWGLSGHGDAIIATKSAIEHAADTLRAVSPGWVSSERVDVAFVFVTAPHAERLGRIGEMIRAELGAKTVIGVSAESVAGGATEIERVAAVSVLACSLPGVRVSPFSTEDLLPAADPSAVGIEQLGQALDAGPRTRATILFADPFSVPAGALLGSINRCMHEMGVRAPLVGGLASGADRPLGNALLLNGRVRRDGLVGVTLSGPLRCDAVVSQGCRSIGEPLVVTGAQRTIVNTLSGMPALRALEMALHPLGESERRNLARGIYLGRAVDAAKDRHGQGDFLIRRVLGADQAMGAIATDDQFRPGQTVQFHLFDAGTASEDLALLLDAQKLHDRPAGAMLISCKDRGRRLFDAPNHDARMISRAFARPPAGEQVSKPGSPAHDDHHELPLAGFFGSAEIGPIGHTSYLHQQTACTLLFRPPEPDDTSGD